MLPDDQAHQKASAKVLLSTEKIPFEYSTVHSAKVYLLTFAVRQ
jgi:hypothetical protein